MNVLQYSEKMKEATTEVELNALLNDAIIDDEIAAKDYGKVNNYFLNRKTQLNIPIYTGGIGSRKLTYED